MVSQEIKRREGGLDTRHGVEWLVPATDAF